MAVTMVMQNLAVPRWYRESPLGIEVNVVDAPVHCGVDPNPRPSRYA